MSLRIFESRKPVIGALNGSAVGVGITMTLPMDIRLLADTAKVGFVFTGRGITPEAASSWFLPRIVGISQALEWVLTARVFRAEEALAGRIGAQPAPARGRAAGGQGAGRGDRHERRTRVGQRQPRAAVADAR